MTNPRNIPIYLSETHLCIIITIRRVKITKNYRENKEEKLLRKYIIYAKDNQISHAISATSTYAPLLWNISYLTLLK